MAQTPIFNALLNTAWSWYQGIVPAYKINKLCVIDWQDHGVLDDPGVTIKEVMQDGAQVEVKNEVH